MTVESLKRGADTPAVGETAETPNGAGAMTVDGEAQPEMTDTGPGDSVRSFESDCSCCRIVSSLQSALRPRSPSGRNCVDSCAPSELGRRSARHARHARRLCCLRLDGAGRLSRLGHKVDYVRRVPRVGEEALSSTATRVHSLMGSRACCWRCDILRRGVKWNGATKE